MCWYRDRVNWISGIFYVEIKEKEIKKKKRRGKIRRIIVRKKLK